MKFDAVAPSKLEDHLAFGRVLDVQMQVRFRQPPMNSGMALTCIAPLCRSVLGEACVLRTIRAPH